MEIRFDVCKHLQKEAWSGFLAERDNTRCAADKPVAGKRQSSERGILNGEAGCGGMALIVGNDIPRVFAALWTNTWWSCTSCPLVCPPF
jgi:hypothetical protein